MNQRFQELAQEAGLYVDVNGQPWPRNMNGEDIEGAYQRFAELIVQECIKVVDDTMTENQEMNIGLVMASAQIVAHFGVEE